jgi:phosphoribosyl-ATP pyrophosphohydrolase
MENSYTVDSYFASRDRLVQEKEKMTFRQNREPDGSFHSELLERENRIPQEQMEALLQKMLEHAGEAVSAYLSHRSEENQETVPDRTVE